MLVVIALGGNALLRRGEKPSIEMQEKNVRKAVKSIRGIAKKHRVVITHGNGPQVGNIMIQVESALGKAYPVPLHVAVAESEGEIGYLLEQALYNEIKKPVVSILTQVIVDKNDTAFKNPTKPIGPYYTKKEMIILKKKGYKMARINSGYRRVVASPRPLKIVEAPVIKRLASMDVIAIAAGGGGIPVYKARELKGIGAVIDKDLASACLAKSIDANLLLILTDVPYAYINYGKKNQKAINKISVKGAKKLLAEGHFPAGSMGPKIQAAIEFAEYGKSIITNFSSLQKAMQGRAGTMIAKQMIKAIIFDVDGLLADTEPLHFLAWKETLKKYNIRFTKNIFMKELAGIGDVATAIYLAKKYGLGSATLVKAKRKIYFKLLKNVKPRKGAKGIAIRFKKFFPVAVASSARSKDALFVLKKIGMLRLFDSITTREDVKRVKPYPDIYLLAARKLGFEAKECVAIEDTEVGIMAANRAGMYCVAVPNEYTKIQDFSNADLVVKSLDQINIKKILNIDKK